MSSFYSIAGSLSAKVSPVVLAAIFDAYQRRPTGAPKVIGALIGRVSGSSVELVDTFVVPHNETGIDKDHFRKSVALLRKLGKETVIVGWFCTGSDLEDSWAVLHAFFATPAESRFVPTAMLPSPFLLVVDPERNELGFNIRGFVSSNTVGSEAIVQFHQVPVELVNSWAEALASMASGIEVEASDLSVDGLIKDLKSKDSLQVSQEVLADVLNAIKMVDSAEKQIIESLRS